MNVTTIYFSPTGKTKEVVDCLTEHWEVEHTYDLSMIGTAYVSAHTFVSDDVCIIAAPTFGGRIPQIFLERLAYIKGNGASAIIIATYGNREYDDALLELKEHAQKCGFTVFAAIAAVTEHSIANIYGQNRPDANDKNFLGSYAAQIQEKVAQKLRALEIEEVTVPGNSPYKEYNGVPFKPQGDDSCISCKLCVESCPTEAIAPEQPQLTKENCISCMRCVAYCPQKARALPAEVQKAVIERLRPLCAEKKAYQLFL